MFKDLKILKVQDIYRLRILTFYYKHTNNTLPKSFNYLTFKSSQDIHHHDTRGNNKLVIPLYKHSFTRNSLAYKVANIINNTEECITQKMHTHSLYGVKIYAKNRFINNYETTCFIQNCYICGN